MSYAMNGYGSYYEYSDHQIFNGYGVAESNIRDTFNPNKVWADAQLGGQIGSMKGPYDNLGCGPGATHPEGGPKSASCAQLWSEMGRMNAAGGRAARAIQAGLNELGYGPIAVDGLWGGGSANAWQSFTTDQNLPAGPGLVNKVGIDAMGQLLKGGKTPGPARAGLGKIGWLLLLLAGGAATVGLVARGRRRRRAGSGRAMVPIR